MNAHLELDPGRLFDAEGAAPELQPYEPPRVLTFRGDEILQLVGPAQACSYAGPTVCPPPTPVPHLKLVN